MTTSSSSPAIDMKHLLALRSTFAQAISEFTASKSVFRIIHTHPPSPSSPPTSASPLKTLYVLDSSFNPPSRAHLALAESAFLSSSSSEQGRKRLVFLLATQNADKAPKPAAFEDRLVLMVMMAGVLSRRLVGERGGYEGDGAEAAGEGGEKGVELDDVAIDIAITKEPYFIDKALAIDDSGIYGNPGSFEQVHVTGFDTLTRLFDAKYYPERGLDALLPFFERHRVRVCLRPGEGGSAKEIEESWGGVEGQKRWVEKNVREEWKGKVELVEQGDEVEGVSSTRVREGVKKGDWDLVEGLVGGEVMGYVREKELYLEEKG